MWYTHYLQRRDASEPIAETQKDIVNEFYRKALRLIIDDNSWLDLLALSQAEADNEAEFNEAFHEYWWDDSNIQTALNNTWEDFVCCKTARKIYDPAIVLSYTLLSYTKAYNFSSDWDVTMFDIDCKAWMAVSLRTYIENELEHQDFDIEELVNLFYIYADHMNDRTRWRADDEFLNWHTEDEEEEDTWYKYKIWDKVTDLDWFTTTIVRLESNNRYKLKWVRWYVKEKELKLYWSEPVATPTIVVSPKQKFYAISALSLEDREYIADMVKQWACQVQVPDSNLILEINLYSNE